jgi:hypothetical protein
MKELKKISPTRLEVVVKEVGDNDEEGTSDGLENL